MYGLKVVLAEDLKFFCKELKNYGFYSLSNVYVIKKNNSDNYIRSNKNIELPLFFKTEEEANNFLNQIYLEPNFINSI